MCGLKLSTTCSTEMLARRPTPICRAALPNISTLFRLEHIFPLGVQRYGRCHCGGLQNLRANECLPCPQKLFWRVLSMFFWMNHVCMHARYVLVCVRTHARPCQNRHTLQLNLETQPTTLLCPDLQLDPPPSLRSSPPAVASGGAAAASRATSASRGARSASIHHGAKAAPAAAPSLPLG